MSNNSLSFGNQKPIEQIKSEYHIDIPENKDASILFRKLSEVIDKLSGGYILDGIILRNIAESIFENKKENIEKNILETKKSSNVIDEKTIKMAIDIAIDTQRKSKLKIKNISSNSKKKQKVIEDIKKNINATIDIINIEKYLNIIEKDIKSKSLKENIVNDFLNSLKNVLKYKEEEKFYFIIKLENKEDKTIEIEKITIEPTSNNNEKISLRARSEIMHYIGNILNYLFDKGGLENHVEEIISIEILNKNEFKKIERQNYKTNEKVLDEQLVEALEKNDINTHLEDNIDNYQHLEEEFKDKLINILYLFQKKKEDILNSFIGVEEKENLYKINFSRKGGMKKINDIFKEIKVDITEIIGEKNISCDFKK